MPIPLQLLNAMVTFYRTDAAGNAFLQEWMGGIAENLTLTETPKERILERSGAARGQARHEEVEYGIEWESLWLHNGTAMPRIGRNVRLVAVIVWQEEESGAWNRRTYYGVTGRSQRIQTSPMFTESLRAEEMAEDTGMGVAPTGPGSPRALVRYCDGFEMLDVAACALDTGVWTPLADAGDAPVALDFSTAGEVVISIRGAAAMGADAEGVWANELVEFSGTPTGLRGARAEFWIGLARLAVLTADGKLLCGLRETADRPMADPAFHFANPAWLFSFWNGAVWAPRLREGR